MATLIGVSPMTIVVNEEFVLRSQPMEIAIWLEYALQQSVREIDLRSRRLIDDYPYVDKRLIGVAGTLEIASDMTEKFLQFDHVTWWNKVSKSISSEHIESFGAENAPELPDEFYTPDDFSLDWGLRMESYFQQLLQAQRDQEDKETQDDESQGDEETQEESESQQSDSAQSQSENEDNEGDSTQGENADIKSPSQSESADGENSTASGAGNTLENQREGGLDGSKSTDGINTSDGDLKSLKSPQNESLQSSEKSGNSKSGESSSAPGDTEDTQTQESADPQVPDSENDSSAPGDSESESNNSDSSHSISGIKSQGKTQEGKGPQVSQTQSSHRDTKTPGNSTSSRFQSSSIDQVLGAQKDPRKRQQTTIPTPPPVGPEGKKGAGSEEKKSVIRKMAEDIAEEIKNTPKGFPTPGVTQGVSNWAKEHIPKGKVNWQNKLKNLLRPIMSAQQMSGQSDLSYSKRNPNQIEGEPILMGFVSYPPNVTVLVDASPSMMGEKKNRMLGEFCGAIKSVFLSYGQEVVVAVADGEIQSLFKSMTPYGRVLREVGKTFHGSSYKFGETFEKTLKKGARHKGMMHPKPDVLVVFTDGEFHWPWPNSGVLPKSYGDVIVVSLNSYDHLEPILPRWVKPGKNFVEAL